MIGGSINGRAVRIGVATILLGGTTVLATRAARAIAENAPAAPVTALATSRTPTTITLDDVAAAAPGKGTTGTAALPAVPVRSASIALGPVSIAARPFDMAGSDATSRSRAIECLTAAIYYEAASESDAGQQAVAQVVLNRVRHPAFPASVCGVVYQGSDRTSGCQFSFACDGAMARMPSRTGWSRATRAAAMALAGQVYAPVGLATHYHTFAVTPSWNRSLVMTEAIGAHFFHRWKGYWGTGPAFSQRYTATEPMPGPHPRLVQPSVTPVQAPVMIAAAVSITPLPPLVQPAYAESGTLRALPVEDPESRILDRWKDSGKPR